MWSIVSPRPLGGLSRRHISLFVSAITMALFATFAINSTDAQAQASNPQATWSGDSIVFEGQTFEKQDPAPNLPGTPCETRDIKYVYFTHQDNDSSKPITEARVICFKGSDADQAEIPANVVTFPDATSESGSGTIDYGIRAENATSTYVLAEGSDGTRNSDSPTSCSSDYTRGLGWIVCPLTNWLAAGMDSLYGIVASFLEVAFLSTNQEGVLYLLWSLMRNVANILFIVGFLLIIYSQTTSFGLSNYGIKRLLPRLAVAAILVNTSYWITALAVDLSNILGYSLQNLFEGVRNSEEVQRSLALATDVKYEDITFEALAGAILSGGTAGAAALGAAAGVITSAGASLWFLLVGLVGVIVSALVAILILAARQALITILIIISPLAFVAYLLPSTENYFQRWRGVFTTMLVVFPAFSVIFGGSQLAGLAIVASANPQSPTYFNVLILGMVVQVAPLILTPLLIKLSGSLLGRIAGIVNNPNRGMIDRTRKFAQSRHDQTKNRQLWDRDKNGNYRNNNPLAWGARKKALRDIHNARKLKAWEGGADAAYAQDSRSHEAHRQSGVNEMLKSSGESEGKAAVSREIASREALRKLYYRQELNQEDAETENKAVKSLYEGLKADPAVVAANALERRIGEQAKEADRRARSIASREATAKHIQERAYNAAITDDVNTDLREFAGFNEIDSHGVARVVNIAQEAEAKSYDALVQAGQRALQREEATLDELLEIIKKGTSSNPKFAHFSDDIESRSAAIRQFMDTAPMQMRHDLAADMDLSRNAAKGTDKGVLRSEIAGALKKNKPFYISQTFLNQMSEGDLSPAYNGLVGKHKMMLDTLNKFAFDPEAMVTIDQDDINAVAEFLNSSEAVNLSSDARKQIINSLDKAFDKDDRYAGRMGKRRNNLNKVRKSLGLREIRE